MRRPSLFLAMAALAVMMCPANVTTNVNAGVRAMKVGKALYLEKPIGIAAGEAENLAEVQHKTGMVFQLGTQRRSSYATKQAIACIRSGKIGKPRWEKA